VLALTPAKKPRFEEDLDPVMGFHLPRSYGQTQALQPRLFRFVISQGNLKGDVINGRSCGIESPKTGTCRSVEESEDLSVTPIAIGDLEENGVVGSPHQLQANDSLIEALHGVEVGHSQGNLAQGFDRSHERNLVEG
jgi:hypothetical protein